VLAGGLTLAMLILPIVIVATREALRTIPVHIREAAYALGATKWQVVRHHLLPYSVGGIATGVIIALSRAIGETAPLITVGALGYIAFLPDSPITSEPPFVSFKWLDSRFVVLPIQMFNWTSRPTEDFHVNAAAAGLVLIAMTLGLNAIAIVVRYRARRKIKW
jgi:phosphate transport system permease protein